eukprot:TRINITY_DN3956_c0_g1_i2.p1 TRINITY_DN3956_c0_g1~~TRINITY_DN3956_c0_g1_i2.p1  ORF type:complete len:174 (-),score=74.72 TRINITY_DN3956_c0_g1_i2:93-545(-)
MAEVSYTRPTQASALRVGGYVMLKGYPCQIKDMATSKTGKHGGAKIHFTGVDIFTGRKYEEISQSTHNMEEPDVKKNEYTIMDIQADNYLSLIDADGETREDIPLPPHQELADQITAAYASAGAENQEVVVQVLSACGTEQIVGFRKARQ